MLLYKLKIEKKNIWRLVKGQGPLLSNTESWTLDKDIFSTNLNIKQSEKGIRPFDMQKPCTKLACYWLAESKQTLLLASRVCLPSANQQRTNSPANSLVVSVVGLELCTAFMWFEFDSRRFQQLFGTPFSKVSLRQLICQKSFQLI